MFSELSYVLQVLNCRILITYSGLQSWNLNFIAKVISVMMCPNFGPRRDDALTKWRKRVWLRMAILRVTMHVAVRWLTQWNSCTICRSLPRFGFTVHGRWHSASSEWWQLKSAMLCCNWNLCPTETWISGPLQSLKKAKQPSSSAGSDVTKFLWKNHCQQSHPTRFYIYIYIYIRMVLAMNC